MTTVSLPRNLKTGKMNRKRQLTNRDERIVCELYLAIINNPCENKYKYV